MWPSCDYGTHIWKEPFKVASKQNLGTVGRRWNEAETKKKKKVALFHQFNQIAKSLRVLSNMCRGSYHRQNFQVLFYKTYLDDTFFKCKEKLKQLCNNLKGKKIHTFHDESV